VLEFRKEIENDNTLVFREYETLDRFREILKDDLAFYLKEKYPGVHEGEIRDGCGIWGVEYLFIQGCGFKDLDPGSRLSPENLEILKQYGARFG
jgi:hypothetical protein